MQDLTPTPLEVRSRREEHLIARKATVVHLAVAVLLMVGFQPAAAPRPALAQSKAEQVGAERLVGRWVRPDGGYVLEIRSAQAGGRLEAAYLNPRSIKVSRAEWRREDGRLLVFVELRDVNYPGSTYNLRYVPDQDRLVGAYYQAVQRQTFDVEFVKQK